MTERTYALPPGMTPRLLDERQAAAYCNCSVDAFADHISTKVPALKVGVLNRWDVKALDAWLDRESGLSTSVESKPVPPPVDDFLERLGQ